MADHIGIVGCSAEGAALCYRTICAEAEALLGEHCHPEVSMHTYPLSEYMEPFDRGDWAGVARLMISSAEKLASIGAKFALCPDNTVHRVFDLVVKESPIPWLHIVDPVAAAARERGYGKLGITGTNYLMTGPVYAERLAAYGLAMEIPDERDRRRIDGIIFSELVKGIFSEPSRLLFNEVFGHLKAKGCDAAVLGCTEIPLLVDPEDTPLPTLDSTRLLARAALRRSIDGA